MAITNIGLRISGTKQRQAGFAPLANAGVLAGGEGDNMDRVPLIAESPAYVIKHAAEYILYLLIDRRVRSFDADAPGVLSIALTIPSNSQLKDDKSPYTLLKEIYNAFVSNFMEQASDGRNTFLNVDSRESTIFRDIVTNYSLEARRSAYVTMNPAGISGVVCVSESDMEDFFRNTQYKEFATFKDIEVGSLCYGQVTPGLERLQIPLPPASYEVWVNDKNTGTTMSVPTDKCLASAPSTVYFSYDSLEFSFGELIGAPDGQLIINGSRVVLDTVKNRIYCTLKKKDIFYDLVVEWKEKEFGCRKAIEEHAKKGNVRLMLEKQDITDVLYSSHDQWSFKAIDVIKKNLSITPPTIGDYTVAVSSRIDENNHVIVIIVTAGRRITKPVDLGHQRSITDKTSRITNGNNPTDDPNYFKRGNRTEETPSQPNQKKAMIDLKSFGLGAIVGLLLGLSIWFFVGLFGGDEEKKIRKNGLADSEVVIPDKENGSSSASSFPSEEKGNSGGEVPEETKDGQTEGIDDVTTDGKSQTSQDLKQQRAEAEAKEKDAAEAARLEAERKAKNAEDKASLIRYVSTKPSMSNYKNHPGYGLLSQSEKIAIESFLNPDQYKGRLNTTALKNLKKKIKDSSYSFQTMDDIRKVQDEINDFLKDPNNQK